MTTRAREGFTLAEQLGFEYVRQDGNNHALFCYPGTKVTIRLPSSPGEGRGDKNMRALLRRRYRQARSELGLSEELPTVVGHGRSPRRR